MSKPRAKATTTGRVEKKAPAKKRKTTVGDKVKGLVEKAEGKIERKPGKKVRHAGFLSACCIGIATDSAGRSLLYFTLSELTQIC